MGYYFATKNTAYVVKSLPNPNTVLLSGGQFDNHEVYAPKDWLVRVYDLSQQ